MTLRFEDIRLEFAVREALDLAGLGPTRAELGRLRSLRAPHRGIQRLGGLAQLGGLRWLDLTRNPLTSSAPLAELPTPAYLMSVRPSRVYAR